MSTSARLRLALTFTARAGYKKAKDRGQSYHYESFKGQNSNRKSRRTLNTIQSSDVGSRIEQRWPPRRIRGKDSVPAENANQTPPRPYTGSIEPIVIPWHPGTPIHGPSSNAVNTLFDRLRLQDGDDGARLADSQWSNLDGHQRGSDSFAQPIQEPENELISVLPPYLQALFKTKSLLPQIRHNENAQRTIGSRRQPEHALTLSTILSTYLDMGGDSSSKAVAWLNGQKTLEALNSKGSVAQDVSSWAWILSAPHSDDMALRFLELSNKVASSGGPQLPIFLLSFLLRALSLKASTFRSLLDHVSQQYTEPVLEHGDNIACEVTSEMAFQILVQLHNHARAVLPQGVEEIAVVAIKLLAPKQKPDGPLPLRTRQILTDMYNRLLAHIAQPAALRPYQSIPFQQRAQLCIVRKMASFQPNLPISRAGFQALAMVQLAHRKTLNERSWAISKSLSWPPWKQEFSGLDANSKDPGKTSRAHLVLRQMSEAGYSHTDWEQAARVLTGWDSSGAPTIQVRKHIKQISHPSKEGILRAAGASIDSHHVWAARILSTRTVREAWVAFKNYEKSFKEKFAAEPFNAMLFRLLHTQADSPRSNPDGVSLVAGDGKETLPEPKSGHDFLYLSSDPPSVDEFFHQMQKRNIRPRTSLVVDLLDSTCSLLKSTSYLKAGIRDAKQRALLLGESHALTRYELRATSGGIPPAILAAWTRLLCRVPVSDEYCLPLYSMLGRGEIPESFVSTNNPFEYALDLIHALDPLSRLPWYALLQGWNRIVNVHPAPSDRSWESFRRILYQVGDTQRGLDFSAYRDISEFLEKHILAYRINDVEERARQEHFMAGIGIRRPINLCKRVFLCMTYGGTTKDYTTVANIDSWLPLDRDPDRLIEVPTPAALHRTIRILGISRLGASIVALIHWMHRHARPLAATAAELANSHKMTRHAITAVRFFLEEAWRPGEFDFRAEIDGKIAHEEKMTLRDEARRIVDMHENDWGGWPDAEQVERYRRGMKKLVYLD